MCKRIVLTASALALGMSMVPVAASVTQEQAERLGKDLTPVGAERAGNADGTIAEWTPGQRRGKLSGEYYSDAAIDAEKPLFTITAANMKQYESRLTEGHKELLRRYPDSYKMHVYPSHRTVAWPEEIYKASYDNALNCTLIDPDSPHNCTLGFPFPIPKNGAEPVWNHRVRWRGNSVTRYNNQMIVQVSGKVQLTKILEEVEFLYANIDNPVPLTKDSRRLFNYLSQTVAPPRLAGTFILSQEKSGTGLKGRDAWFYSPGLRRIRRAPTVCCDNPFEGTDGHQFYDQVDMFNGVLERFNWKLLGKKEVYIPYNANKISGPSVKYADMATPRHLNQKLARYEMHRVWVVEGDNKAGLTHTFKKRRFYLDEDSWNIVAADDYDHRDQLFQFQEGHLIFTYNILATFTAPEVIYHFNSGRYFVTAMANEDKPNNYEVTFPADYFTASALQKQIVR